MANAIRAQAEGQTWNLTGDSYDLTKEFMDKYAEIDVYGTKGWYFPITADNITINGNGATITSSEYSENGNWNTQDFIVVAGDGVTIDNVKIESKEVVNKAIEVLGKDFKLSNSEILPVAYDNSGSIYFEYDSEKGIVSSGTLENVEIHSWITYEPTDANVGLTLDGVTIDFVGNDYTEYYNMGVISDNPGIKVEGDGLTVLVDA